jgi:hypothetical protein
VSACITRIENQADMGTSRRLTDNLTHWSTIRLMILPKKRGILRVAIHLGKDHSHAAERQIA